MMNIRSHFLTIWEYSKFIMAKEFRYADNLQIRTSSSTTEKVTNTLLSPLKYCVDNTLKNIYKPGFIAAINVIGIGVITTVIYPDQTFGFLQIACSPFFNLNSSMLKFSTYITIESIITLLMIRSISRLRQEELLRLWKTKSVIPIQLGMEYNTVNA